jgi:hypothetical protein
MERSSSKPFIASPPEPRNRCRYSERGARTGSSFTARREVGISWRQIAHSRSQEKRSHFVAADWNYKWLTMSRRMVRNTSRGLTNPEFEDWRGRTLRIVKSGRAGNQLKWYAWGLSRGEMVISKSPLYDSRASEERKKACGFATTNRLREGSREASKRSARTRKRADHLPGNRGGPARYYQC